MSIDSQELNITGGVKVSGHVKSNFGVNFGVGTDSPSDAVHVAHTPPALAVQQQATSGGTVTSYGKVHADSGTLHIQSGVDGTSDSKGDIVLGSVGSATKHVVVKGATSNVGIGTDDPAYGLDVVPSARFTGNVVASNLSANAITLAELSLEVTQGLDNVVNVDNTTGNTIAMSNVTDSTSTSSGALTVAGGIGVGGNVHCSNLHASNITMNLFSFTGAQTFEQVVNTGRVLNSNVLIISNATPSTSASTGALTLTAGGLGVEGNVHVGSNLFVDSNLEVGTANLFVDTVTGNVGMGTTNPVSILHVRGTGQTSLTSFNTSQTLGASIFAESSDSHVGSGGSLVLGTYQGKFAAIKAGILDGTSNTVGNLHFMTRNAIGDATLTNRMTIDKDGNVGIGTTSPRTKLEVYGPIMGSTNSTLYSHNLYYDTQWKYAEAGYGGATMRMINSEVQFWNAPNNNASANSAATLTQRFTITENGNVGINKTSGVSHTLDVTGGIHASGSLSLGGSSNLSYQRKYVGVNNGFVNFTIPLNNVCAHYPGILKLHAHAINSNSAGSYGWHWIFSFNTVNCGTHGWIINSTLYGSDPGTSWLAHSMDSSTGVLTITCKNNSRNYLVADCEVSYYGGIF